jgi:hypothetical protein
MSYYNFHVDIPLREAPRVSFECGDLSRSTFICRHFDCRYSYETGLVLAHDGGVPFEFYIGRVPETQANEQLIRDTILTAIQLRLGPQVNRDVERHYRDAEQEYRVAWDTFQQMTAPVSACLEVASLSPHRQEAGPSPTSNQPRRTGRATRPKRRHYLTLVPYINFTKCAKCLHDRDLKLMRVAALRVLKLLNNPRSDTPRGVTLWVGYTQALIRYGIAIATECRRRGFADTSLGVFQSQYTPGLCAKPEWIKWASLRKSHQAYLMLREERRYAAKALIKWARPQMYRGQKMLLIDVCNLYDLDQRRTWQHHALQHVQHSIMSQSSHVLLPFRSEYAASEGWIITPEENFRYPGN